MWLLFRTLNHLDGLHVEILLLSEHKKKRKISVISAATIYIHVKALAC